jgi:hypothetical protein
MTTVDIAAENQAIIVPINEDYEWIQYNEDLRLLHSIRDDMYQGKSIIQALNSQKRFRNWISNDQTKELIEGFVGAGIPAPENKPNEVPGFQGYYVHRLFVNIVATWASPEYAYKIAILLDSHFENQRNELQNQINSLKPRTVPKKKEKNYHYMIYQEDLPENMIILHLTRRSHRSFSTEFQKIRDSNKCLFYRDNLPIAMTPNEDVKDIIKRLLPRPEYQVIMSKVRLNRRHLALILPAITEYFEHIHE